MNESEIVKKVYIAKRNKANATSALKYTVRVAIIHKRAIAISVEKVIDLYRLFHMFIGKYILCWKL